MDTLPRLDKSKLLVTSLYETEGEKSFWLSKGAKARLEAVELNRRMVYGHDRVTSRLQRVLETLEHLP